MLTFCPPSSSIVSAVAAEPLGWQEFRWPDQYSPWSFRVEWHAIDGRAECTSLEVVSKPPQPVTSHLLRELYRYINGPLRQQRASSVEHLARHAGNEVAERARRQVDVYGDRAGKPGPKPRSLGHYEQVAELYVEARGHGVPTAPFIAERMMASPSTVRNWLQRCRELGLIGTGEARQ